MEKRWFISMLLLAVVAGASDAELKVQVQLKSGKNFAGVLLERSGDNLSFQPSGAEAPVPVPVASVESLEFKFSESGLSETDRLFGSGDYEQLRSVLDENLPPFLPYAEIPSNLQPKLSQWLAATYWSGRYDQVLKVAGIAAKTRTATLAREALFYSMLTFLEQDGAARVKPFLETKKGAGLFPEGSAPRLYVQARILQLEEQYIPAMRIAADLVANHGRDADWAPQAELLCAELYFKTGRPESANAVLESIQECYASPLITKKAAAIAAQNRTENE
ncbi:MAG: hypothetical protein ISR84_03135 [Kiritimatiellales bacterium]|nr:hypothetical protein [Kiritimatiellales bacterium]